MTQNEIRTKTQTDWQALLERVEEGMTTVADADAIRDLLNSLIDYEQQLQQDLRAIYGVGMGWEDAQPGVKDD